ncbi:hypothetical protein GW17_00008450 [Ensete ventricosum]|nr:hypothetical protein GW17_00008450 [Ensete ventricosum]
MAGSATTEPLLYLHVSKAQREERTVKRRREREREREREGVCCHWWKWNKDAGVGGLIMGPKAGVSFDYFEGKRWEKGWPACSHADKVGALVLLSLCCVCNKREASMAVCCLPTPGDSRKEKDGPSLASLPDCLPSEKTRTKREI